MLEGSARYYKHLGSARIKEKKKERELQEDQIAIVYFVGKVQKVAHHFFLL